MSKLLVIKYTLDCKWDSKCNAFQEKKNIQPADALIRSQECVMTLFIIIQRKFLYLVLEFPSQTVNSQFCLLPMLIKTND